MPENRLVTLVRRLHKRSMEGQLSWEDTPKDGTYKCSSPEYTLHLHARPSQQDPEAMDYVLSILNNDNVLIEEVDDIQLQRETEERGVAYRLMGEMYAAARRTALGTEAALDSLLEALGEDSELGSDSEPGSSG